MQPIDPAERDAVKFASALDRILAPIDRQTFLNQYWGRSFLRVPGRPGRFQSILPWSELNEIVERHHLEPPQLRLYRDGKPVDIDRYCFKEDGSYWLKTSGLMNCLSQGATLVLDDMQNMAPKVREISDSCEEILRAFTKVNLYAGWRTQKGFNLHYDEHETMMLQIAGRKHWKVYRPTRPFPIRRDLTPAPEPTEGPIWDGVLEDGDMMYLPRGWWHVAHPLDEASLHLTVTVVPARGSDFIHWMADRLLSEELVRRDVPNLPGDSRSTGYVGEIRETLARFLHEHALEEFLADWESRIFLAPRIDLENGPRNRNRELKMESRIRLATARRICVVLDEGGGAFFHANDTRWECTREQAPLLARLRAHESVSVRELSAELPDEESICRLILLLSALEWGGVIARDGD